MSVILTGKIRKHYLKVQRCPKMERTTAEAVSLGVLNIAKIPLCRWLKKKLLVVVGRER